MIQGFLINSVQFLKLKLEKLKKLEKLNLKKFSITPASGLTER